MLTWLRRWRERLAKAQDEADQKRWDVEQVRRRESLELQAAQKWIENEMQRALAETLKGPKRC